MQIKKLSKIIPLLFISILSLSILGFSYNTYAQDICSAEGVSSEMKEAAGCEGAHKNIAPLITGILNTIIGITGIIAVIFVIIGGVNYMTSAGDAGKVKKARDTILYACIGLIICALSFAIVNFVISNIIKGQSSTDTSQEETTTDKPNPKPTKKNE